MGEAAEPPEAPTSPEVTVRVPGLLDRFIDGQRSVTVRAETVRDSLDRLLDRHPALEPHLYDSHGELRPHLRVFYDGTDVTDADDIAVTTGDEVVVFQAVSGGASTPA